MPELPDLEYIVVKLAPLLTGRLIDSIIVKEPIIFRIMLSGSLSDLLKGQEVVTLYRHGPFLVLTLKSIFMVIHFMLSGAIQYIGDGGKREKNETEKANIPYLAFTLKFDNGDRLNFSDRKKMARVYISDENKLIEIPGFSQQGIDVLSGNFTFEAFNEKLQNNRAQTRVFLMDQRVLSAIGNAYADEILFDAGIHPKTFCNQLDEKETQRLYKSIKHVIAWGIREVSEANRGTEHKHREHLLVRNQKNERCKRCGALIRRVQVHGYDSFFCPGCQPPKNRSAIPWDH